ncbi:Aromatic aminotransferase ISS1 [Psilocybe cubensis]|uniref:Aromatic aminotransferase ISS1 n=2 Tax=Psilocybe cubensis TaxID=181762 RepID=A0ACB8HDP2_PSICU|nr:Aromatic aminotransferase ISS1 [Psilocybe cubensis]KAH9486038.1 Aromatic aminotransferase ISS1 [Psilocybe cubensis]
MSTSLGFRVSRGVLSTIAPPIPLAYEWASRYKPSEKRPLLDMSQGVPGVPPPDSVQSALGKAASSPTSFGYTRWDGEPDLRQALVGQMKLVYGSNSDINADDVALTSGCNLAFVATTMSVADAGDEIILPVPWYFNHQMTLTLLGIKTIPLTTRPEDGFTPSVDRCRELITKNTKAIVLVTPNNPTGATYSPTLISEFAALAAEFRVALIVDETYRDFIVTGSPPHTVFSNANSLAWRSTFIHLFSFSKAYCLPGHRLGAIVASPILLRSIKSILDTLQICAPRPIQMALAPLLPELRSFITTTAKQVHARHQLFKSRLPEKWHIGAQGGYYAYVKHPFLYVKATDVSRRLAEQVGVVTLPSSFFLEEKESGDKGDQDRERNDEDWKNVEADVKVEEVDRWIRFSVANIDDHKVVKVCERLGQCGDAFGWKQEDDSAN